MEILKLPLTSTSAAFEINGKVRHVQKRFSANMSYCCKIHEGEGVSCVNHSTPVIELCVRVLVMSKDFPDIQVVPGACWVQNTGNISWNACAAHITGSA